MRRRLATRWHDSMRSCYHLAMTSALVALTTGFLLGLRHATDPDHVVAVSTVVARGGGLGPAVRVGTLWGIGHSAMVMAAGGAMVATGVVVPPRMAGLLELAVAVMLLVLGVTGVRRAVRAMRTGSPPGTPAAPRRWARPVVVGLVHGMAGSGAVALAVLAGVTDRSVALGYLVTFGAGTLVGMVGVTLLLAAPVSLAARRLDARWAPRAGVLFGALSIVLGGWMFHHIGFVEGVLTTGALAANAP